MSEAKNSGGDDFGSNRASMTLEKYLPLYKIHREYLIQESSLINNRLTWILTIHGFLYATYGLTLQKELEIIDKIKNYDTFAIRHKPACYMLGQVELFLAFISIIGAAISYFGWVSIMSAQRANTNVASVFDDKANKAHKQSPDKDEKGNSIRKTYETLDGYILPGLRGGGDDINVADGYVASRIIPLFLFGGWTLSLAVLLWIGFKNNSIICLL